jgi:hypothetical protein
MDHPWIAPKLLGWIFPGYPSRIQLDGFWAMDEFGTLPWTGLIQLDCGVLKLFQMDL